MAAQESEIVDSKQVIPLCDYQFSGDSTTVGNKCRIVEGYRLKASIYHAAQFAGVHRATVYRYLDNDPEFAQAMEDSFEDAADIAESSVYERAIGRDCKPDSLLAMFWLKAHRPKYRDRVSVDLEVVRSEIEQRMTQLGVDRLPQLPAVMTEFLNGSGGLQAESIESTIPVPLIPVIPTQFPHPPQQIQKEMDSDSSSSE